jgi:hypothetical protein
VSRHDPFMMNKDRSKLITKEQVQMATQYTYNSMGVGRRGRLTKEEMDKIQHDICTEQHSR